MKNNIVSLSGGKDSTAMLLMMLERKEPIHSVVFFDTGWEFPQIYDHILNLQSKIDIEIKIIQPNKKFNDLLKKWRWPAANRRWCTGEKRDALAKYSRTVENAIEAVGYAYDERHRTSIKPRGKRIMRYPLIEYGVTEADALQYCFDKGFNWGGVYDHLSRVSCFCCTLQTLSNLRNIRRFYPDQWQEMKNMGSKLTEHYGLNDSIPGFRGAKSIHDIDKRFYEEDRQLDLFPGMEEGEWTKS